MLSSVMTTGYFSTSPAKWWIAYRYIRAGTRRIAYEQTAGVQIRHLSFWLGADWMEVAYASVFGAEGEN